MKATAKPGRVVKQEKGWCLLVGERPVGFANMATFEIETHFPTEARVCVLAEESGIAIANMDELLKRRAASASSFHSLMARGFDAVKDNGNAMTARECAKKWAAKAR